MFTYLVLNALDGLDDRVRVFRLHLNRLEVLAQVELQIADLEVMALELDRTGELALCILPG